VYIYRSIADIADNSKSEFMQPAMERAIVTGDLNEGGLLGGAYRFFFRSTTAFMILLFILLGL